MQVGDRVFTVGEAARRAGVTAKAVRLYEARGLLLPAPRTPAGYRTYTSHDVRLLRFIRGARSLGLGLAEIRQILDLRRSGTPPSQELIAAVERHLSQIERSIADLLLLKENLAGVLDGARATAALSPSDGLCAFVAALDDGDDDPHATVNGRRLRATG